MRRKPNKIDPRKKSIARALFYLNTILWFVYAIYIYFDMAVINHNELSADIATIYVLVNAAAMFAGGLMLGKQQKPAFYFALIVLALNIVLALANVTDIFFLVALMIDVVILWALLPLRKDYLS
jgi:lysylphosphatidylglycerol synthetase-like protein (DUF2156 family)